MRQVVVTGGGTGIGYAIAEEFVRDGEAVTITGRRAEVLTRSAKELGARAVAFDAADADAVTAALDELPDSVDVIVNNAGGNTDFHQSIEDGSLSALAARWRGNFESNVLSAVLVTSALSSRLADHGRVITIGSIAAHQAAGSYGAAKAAVEGWTADVAGRLGPRGVTANVIAPGLVRDTEFFNGNLSQELQESLVASTSNKRAGTPEDVAALAAFLASDRAGHITGQVLHVNGGAYLGR